MDTLVIYALVAAAQTGIIGLAFYPVFEASRVFNVTQGSVYAASGFITLWIVRQGASMPIAILGGILASCLLGVGLDLTVKTASAGRKMEVGLASFLVCLGLYIVFESVFAIGFGDDMVLLHSTLSMGRLRLGSTVITAPQYLTVVVAVIGLVFFYFLYQYTDFGRRLRAVAESRFLASVFGIGPSKTRMQAVALGSLFMSIAGLLNAMDTGLRPTMGFYSVLVGALAAILAGRRGPLGAMAAGALIGATNSLIVWAFDGRWQGVVTYGLLLLVSIFWGKMLIEYRTGKQTV